MELQKQIWTQLLTKDEEQMAKLDGMLVEQKQKFYTEDNIKDQIYKCLSYTVLKVLTQSDDNLRSVTEMVII